MLPYHARIASHAIHGNCYTVEMHHCFDGTFGTNKVVWGQTEANKGSRFGSVLFGDVVESERSTTASPCVELNPAQIRGESTIGGRSDVTLNMYKRST